MRGVNKVILLGHVGQQPEISYLNNGSPVTKISLATTNHWKDKQTGEKKESTEWHRIVSFNKLAEIISQYVQKGSKIYIEGKLQTRKWEDNEGNTRYTTEVLATEVQLLDSRASQDKAPSSESMGTVAGDYDDDDIPF